MHVLGGQRSGLGKLLRASVVAAVAAWFICGPLSMVLAADDVCLKEALAAEQRLLGNDDEAAHFAAYLPFTREIAVEGAVVGSFDASLKEGDVPATATLEVRRALSTVIDLGREVAEGDHFYVRYQQTFTLEGMPVGVARVLWAEIVTKARGPVAIYRYRPLGGVERFRYACPSTP